MLFTSLCNEVLNRTECDCTSLYRQQFDVTIMQFRKSQKDLNIRLEMEYKSAIDEFSQRQAMQNRVSLLSPIFEQL